MDDRHRRPQRGTELLLINGGDRDLEVVDKVRADVAARGGEARAASLAEAERFIAEHAVQGR